MCTKISSKWVILSTTSHTEGLNKEKQPSCNIKHQTQGCAGKVSEVTVKSVQLMETHIQMSFLTDHDKTPPCPSLLLEVPKKITVTAAANSIYLPENGIPKPFQRRKLN